MGLEFSEVPTYSGMISVVVNNAQNQSLMLSFPGKPIQGSTFECFYQTQSDPSFRSFIHAMNGPGMVFNVTIQLYTEDPNVQAPFEEERDAQVMLQLFQQRHLADARVVCGMRSWAVHKCVLAAQSAVFRRELAQNGNEINVQADPLLVEDLVQFLYLGKVQNPRRQRELAKVAYRYQIRGL